MPNNTDFPRSLALLRKEKGISQRQAAKALGIGQALLSHYENGTREPGLAFVARACDFYKVSADFLLGRTLSREGTTILDADSLYDASSEENESLKGGAEATLEKKLLVNSVSILFDLLGQCGSSRAVRSAGSFLSTAIYQLYRLLYQASGAHSQDVFSLSSAQFSAGAPAVDMVISEVDYADALSEHSREKGGFPDMSNDALAADYPGAYQSLLRVLHRAGERINKQISLHRETEEK